MSMHGAGPTDDGLKRPGKYKEHEAFPENTVPGGVRGALKLLQELEISDMNGGTFCIDRIVLSFKALNEAEQQFRSCERLSGKGIRAAQTLLETLCAKARKVLFDLRAWPENEQGGPLQLGALLGDKLASIWSQTFVATDAEPEVLAIAKDLCAIFGLTKLTNIDNLPRNIQEAANLSALGSYGLWGVAQAYFGMMANETRTPQHLSNALLCSYNKADAARKLAGSPPEVLTRLNETDQTDRATEAFQVASELLIHSVRIATATARDQGVILRAQGVSEFVTPFIARLDASQLRMWMTDYSITCRQAHRQGEFEIAQKMWNRLEELADSAGDSLAVDALRFKARRIKSDLSRADLAKAGQAIATFRESFSKLEPEAKHDLSFEAMTVAHLAISLRLAEVQESEGYGQAEELLSDACKEVDLLASLVEHNSAKGVFLVVESLLDIAAVFLEQGCIDESREQAFELWARASRLLDEAETYCTEGVLYARVTCRIFLAEIGALFDDPDIKAAQRAGLERLWGPLVATLEAEELEDNERSSYQIAQISLLRTFASIECSLDEEGSEAGVEAIREALKLYQSYSVGDSDESLIRSLYEVAIDVYDRNGLYVQARQFREKLDLLG